MATKEEIQLIRDVAHGLNNFAFGLENPDRFSNETNAIFERLLNSSKKMFQLIIDTFC